MRHFYTGLLFFGASFAAHAAEDHKHHQNSRNAPSAMHYTQHLPQEHPHNSVVYSDFQSDQTRAPDTRQWASDRSDSALTQSQRDVVNVLNALLHQRMTVLQNDKMRLSVSPDAAVMESGHLKVALQNQSTTVAWSHKF